MSQTLARGFHPLVWSWFIERFQKPTAAQEQGWPLLRAGVSTLIAAPTGGGKTLSAFFVAIDQLVQQGLRGDLERTEGVQVLYLSPLRALSNDIKKNLEEPLREITARLEAAGLRPPAIKVGLRTGDSTASERARLVKHPPHILVTTPESLFLMMSSSKARSTLKTVHTVIVDEIHALARDKRGSHLSLSLEHLQELCPVELVRIGLSATQKPLDRIASFLVGHGRPCKLVDVSQQREADLDLLLPDQELGAVCSHEMWAEIYQKLAAMIQEHRSSLIFVNTRRMAERITFQLSELVGEDAIACHHGSLSKEKRLEAEDRLKQGNIKAIVATASLELGIDVGTIDLVCQIGSPRSIASFVQRVGRSGHALGLRPKARLIALTRDELIECLALMRAYREGAMDSIEIPEQAIDILAQHLVSIISCTEQSPAQLLELCRRAYPYRELTLETLEKVLGWLSEGLSASTRKGSYLHWDKVNQILRPRRSARLAVITSGGAIPEQNLYRVVNASDQSMVGTVDEEFALEAGRGDVFLLGNQSWQIQGLKGDVLQVQDLRGAPPTIPFWKGEAGGRTFELSAELARLREEADSQLPLFEPEADAQDEAREKKRWDAHCQPLALHLATTYGIEAAPAQQAAQYLAAQKLAIGLLPTQKRIVYERFFDETGGMQLIVHAPFGSRINRAWGLAFRKRFCRGFDFELQAAATDNGLLLSVGPNQSFPLEAMFGMLNAKNCREILVQALLDVPMFEIRWRWNVTRALAVLRSKGGKRVPPHLQRYQSNDLLTAVFPGQTQCFEHRTGDLEVPDHPLVQQTVYDCLQEAMDAQRFEELIRSIDQKEIELIARDTREPSPFCYELIHANPYAFLDEAPLEERRVRALSTRRALDPGALRELGSLAPEAISQVTSEAWPFIRDPDELYDALKQLVLLEASRLAFYSAHLATLLKERRAFLVERAGRSFYAAHERLAMVSALFPEEALLAGGEAPTWEQQTEALKSLLRGQLECRGTLLASELAAEFGLALGLVQTSLQVLESEGVLLSGHFSSSPDEAGSGAREREWCERRLLQRMHRLTIEGLREQIKPVAVPVYIRFLCQHQHLGSRQLAGIEGLKQIIEQLQGLEAPAVVWENELFLSRLEDFSPRDLDQLCLSGQTQWGRIRVPQLKGEKTNNQRLFTRQTKISFMQRSAMGWTIPEERGLAPDRLSERAKELWALLENRGALFYDELQTLSRQLPSQLEDALSELISMGLVHADSFAPIRPLINPDRRLRSSQSQARSNPRQIRYKSDFASGGRYAPFARLLHRWPREERLEAWAWQLLSRYGVVFRDLLQREELAPNWGELVSVYRTLEARGQIRGGRFVDKVGGEQFALKEAVERLRAVRDEKPSEDFFILSASDPANLMGMITSDAKLPSLSGNRVALWQGEYVAWKNRSDIHFAAESSLPPSRKADVERALRLNGMFRRHDPFIRHLTSTPPPTTKEKAEPEHPEGRELSPAFKNWRDIFKK